ncbi:class I SAM-dependent methyltransferase [Patescibacteria group bacterium]|nr:class I SAM-dependent methyltransferase [Patescibacteria group bacterium]MBU1683082.1 class I SAM-dependent methyltransferase [Patescibacteria group bacterium]MBU1935157.1 class I SAM-dependent methyltransferase [Patescibacteria group bacterium]
MRKRTDLSKWGADEAEKYAAAKHGPDGARFLDPHLYALMSRNRLEGTDFADLGTGAAPWAYHALMQGADHVAGFDLSPSMLQQARKRLGNDSGFLPRNAELIEADVAHMPCNNESFDSSASVNVGCNLPPSTFAAHFREAFRITKPGGNFTVAAPISLLTTFTGDDEVEDVQTQIDRAWEIKEGNVKEVIGQVRGVLRATFILDPKSGKPILVTEENSDLVENGDPILRIIPGLVVDNNFHTIQEYREEALRAGWNIRALIDECFRNEQERADHNLSEENPENRLGPEYVGNPPFLLMDLKKE